MPATPAWPPQSTPRLFVDSGTATLAPGAMITIEGAQAHYLSGVMRVKPGDPVKLFDGASGEWLGVVGAAGRRTVSITIDAQLRGAETVPDLWLCAAPLKKARIDWVAEKACELGVARLVPVTTSRTVVDRLNLGRLRQHMIEAAEQCGRTAVPELAEPVALRRLLESWPAGRTLLFADENGGEPALAAIERSATPAAILIGPEGGFDDSERAAIRAQPGAVAIDLGPRILRADTAAVAAIALWMGVRGDWSH